MRLRFAFLLSFLTLTAAPDALAQVNGCSIGALEVVVEIYPQDLNGTDFPNFTGNVSIYKTDGTQIHSATITSDPNACDWSWEFVDPDGVNPTAFCDLDEEPDPGTGEIDCEDGEFVITAGVTMYTGTGEESAGGSWLYVPEETNSPYEEDGTFYFPHNGGASPDLTINLYPETGRAEAGGTLGATSSNSYEDVLGEHYVIPYDYDLYCGGCGGHAQYFLTPYEPTSDPGAESGEINPVVPTFTFADRSGAPARPDVVIPASWPVQTWALPNLTLQFPQGVGFKLEEELNAYNVTFTEAVADEGWDGIGVAATGTFRVTGPVHIRNTTTDVNALGTITGPFDVAPGGGLNLEDATLAFARDADLVVEGYVLAEGSKLTRAAGATSWGNLSGGLVVRLPQEGDVTSLPVSTLFGGTIVEHVGPPTVEQVAYTGAVGVYGRELRLDGAQIQDSQGGVLGLLASGELADVTVTGQSVVRRNNGGGGALALAGADLTIEDGSEVRDNPGGGAAASGYGSLLTLDDVTVQENHGTSGFATPGVRALYNSRVEFADGSTADEVAVLNNDGGLDARTGGTLDAGTCVGQTCTGAEHRIVGNALTGYFDGRSKNGSHLYAEGNDWDVTDVSQLELDRDCASVLRVCPIVGGTCVEPPCDGGAGRQAGGALRGTEDVLALVEAAERAHLAGDMAAFEIAADAVVATLGASATEDERRAAFEATTRLFAWAQPAGPLASLSALAGQPGEAQPWSRRALGVARASAEEYAEARALADTLASAYAGSEHAQYGLGLAVRVAVAEEDETGALAALSALASSFPEAEELPGLAALVLGAFPDAQVEGALNGRPPASARTSEASSAASPESALLALGAVQPNPTVSSALILFELAEEAMVEAVLYDALGRRVAVLAAGRYGAGLHTVAFDGSALPAGAYVVHITAQSSEGRPAVAVRRITITR
jgi:hypothetical protein